MKTVESATGMAIFPDWINLGGGRYADDLGINVWGLAVCTAGYLAGAVLFARKLPAGAESGVASS